MGSIEQHLGHGASRGFDTPLTKTQKTTHSSADTRPRCFTVKLICCVAWLHSNKSVSSAGCGKLTPALAPRSLYIAKFYLQIERKYRADERTRTAETCSH